MPSTERDDVLEQFEYHHWATDRVLEVAAALTAAQLDKEWGGSFGSGRGLLRHVIGVERLWLERWNGRSMKGLPEFALTWSGRDFLNEWKKIAAEQGEYLSELSRDMLLGELTYTNIKGERLTYRLAEILAHVVNHGTYHRGQITHLLRDCGVTAPSTDFLVFVGERRKSQA
ncbi:MAG: DinB family protein [Gemmatimonadota bacterium]